MGTHFQFKNMQNDNRNNPSVASRQPPLHKGTFYCLRLRGSFKNMCFIGNPFEGVFYKVHAPPACRKVSLPQKKEITRRTPSPYLSLPCEDPLRGSIGVNLVLFKPPAKGDNSPSVSVVSEEFHDIRFPFYAAKYCKNQNACLAYTESVGDPHKYK